MQLFYMNLDDKLEHGRRRVIRLQDGYHYQSRFGKRWDDIAIYIKPYDALMDMFDQNASLAMLYVMDNSPCMIIKQ